MVQENKNKAEENVESLKFGRFLSSPAPGEEVVISGIAGYFPKSDNMYELRDNLLNHAHMTDQIHRHWDKDDPKLVYKCGIIKDLSRFDSAFFEVHYQEAETMCPMLRCSLERTYEAILDAGIHPSSLKGTRTGVYVASSCSEAEADVIYENLTEHAYPIRSTARNMIPSRITHLLGVQGPSFGIDTACSSALYVLNEAYEAIRTGVVDYAIVGGCHVCLCLNTTIDFDALGIVAHDGKVKAFDQKADGYTRSETIAYLFLQKAKDAKRTYATIVHSKVNSDGFKLQGITYPGGETQAQLFREFYQECNINPASIDYLEAHATGTKVGDAIEMAAVADVFCSGRQSPLPVGSCKSNLGHSEPSSGCCSFAKVIVAMECGIIPANMHYNTPKEEIPSLSNGKAKVVSENTPLTGDLIAVNAFGFGGCNAHVLLRRNTKTKVNGGAPEDCLPRLVVASGRTMEAITSILDDVESRPVDAEFISLLHEVFAVTTPGHIYRGYTLVGGDNIVRKVQYCSSTHRPIWFVFCGFADHWVDIGRSLLQLPPFESLVNTCDDVLRSKGLSMKKIILSGDTDSEYKFLVRTVIQIGFVDILDQVGIRASGLLSFTIGEIACAYADGCLSAEQAILVAYYYSVEMRTESQENLAANLRQIIHKPKKRSISWVTTTLTDSSPKFANAEFFSECFYSPVYDVEALHNIDDNSIVIDFSGPGSQEVFLQNLKHKNIKIIPFLSTSGSNPLEQLSSLLGRLYLAGLQPDISKLYPRVKYPVSRSTPMISPLIRWEHSKEWTVCGLSMDLRGKAEKCKPISLKENEDNFYKGHNIDGRVLFPATGYLCLVWDKFSQMNGSSYKISVVFKDVRFNRATSLTEEGRVDFIISIQRKSGDFVVSEGGSDIVTGKIKTLEASDEGMLLDLKLPNPVQGRDLLDLQTKDIYKELRLRGYNYRDLFRGLIKVDPSASTGLIKWNDNWVGFMDTILQLEVLFKDSRSLYVPTGIDTVVIDITKHGEELAGCFKENELPIYAWKKLNIVRAGGVEMRGLSASVIARRKPLGEPVLERYQFVPNTSSGSLSLSLEQTVRLCVHVMLENHLGNKVTVYEMAETENDLLSPLIQQTFADLPLLQGEITVLIRENTRPLAGLQAGIQVVNANTFPANQNATLAVGTNILSDGSLLLSMVNTLEADGCILVRERLSLDLSYVLPQLSIIMDRVVGTERLVLLKKTESDVGSPVVINITEKNFSWLPQLQTAVNDTKPPQRVVLVAQGESLNGIMGLFNCIRREPGGHLTRCFFVLDAEAPVFDPSHPLYLDQLKKDLAVNVLQDGQWGSYRHLLLEPPPYITAPHGYNNVRVRGDLSSLTWFEGPISDLSHPEDIIHIYYSALNFKDVMLSTGKLVEEGNANDRTKQDIQLGFEFSGRDTNGKRIMGMSDVFCFSNITPKKSAIVWEVPDSWTLEEAATVPVVYATAIHALKVEGRLQPGESVLIHAGSGGVGQAAINYCLFHGCTVFTTVGTQEKREFIKKHFPQITDDYICNSRDLTFEEFIINRTGGRGVDVILNSLAEEKLQASIRCLAKGGRFLEIGKYDMVKNNYLGASMFKKDQSFHSVMLDLFFDASSSGKQSLHSTLQTAILEGSVRPLVRTVFDTDHVEDAFRFMAAGKHIGKVLVEIRPEEEDKTAKPNLLIMKVRPRFHCGRSLSYIILGGLGGFGLELSDWLVLRGARNLVLTSRRGITTGYQSSRIRIWRSYGVRVEVVTTDVSTAEGAAKLLNEANAIAPVGGIFNLAVVLRDSILENQTEESFQESFKGKALATRHLDVLSRQLCPQLRQFVVFSSVSCGRGNAGQTNYGMSNSVMERICDARVRDGLPGVAIQWGAVGDVGLVADMQEEHQELVIGGTLQQRISSCLEVLDDFLKQPHPVVSSMVVAEKRAFSGNFANIVDCVANILGLRDVKTVSAMSPLTELGMDSIMAVEIKQTLERDYELFLTPQEIRNLTFKNLEQLARTETADEQPDQPEEPEPETLKYLSAMMKTKDITRHTVLPLPSLTTLTTSSPLFMLPGIEGVTTSLEDLSKSINAPCIGVQLCFNDPNTRLEDMALQVLKSARERLIPGSPFNLLGHSFGGLVALQMASVLENEGLSGRIFLLDSSPEFSFQLTEKNFAKGATNECDIQINILCSMLRVSYPALHGDSAKLRAELRPLSEWNDRVKKAVESSPEDERDVQQALLTSMWTNIKAIRNFNWPEGRQIKSEVILVRPRHTPIQITEDYGLSKICQQSVAVHFVEGNHTSILQNPITAQIINQKLNECS